jgi:hypothetical protein
MAMPRMPVSSSGPGATTDAEAVPAKPRRKRMLPNTFKGPSQEMCFNLAIERSYWQLSQTITLVIWPGQIGRRGIVKLLIGFQPRRRRWELVGELSGAPD